MEILLLIVKLVATLRKIESREIKTCRDPDVLGQANINSSCSAPPTSSGIKSLTSS